MVALRDATADDFDAWFALRDAVATEGRWIGVEGPLDRDENRRWFDMWVNSPGHRTLLAVEGDEVVGSIGMHLDFGVVHLGMWIDAARRGQGIGRLLIEECIAWARAQGAHKVALEAWPHNEAAIRLYERTGFEHEGRLRRRWRRRDGSLWDSVVMGLVLDDASPGSPHPDAV